MLQRSNTDTWCINPVSGEVFQRGSKDSDGNPECELHFTHRQWQYLMLCGTCTSSFRMIPVKTWGAYSLIPQ